MKATLGIWILSFCLPCLAFAVEGNVSAGKQKALTCGACHGADGNSAVPAWPKIAGQHASYLYAQLQAFKQGEQGTRYQAVMSAQVANLTDQDMADIAAFYASQTVKAGETAANYVALGQKVYRGGNRAQEQPACMACHGPDGKGNAQAGFPALSGQFAEYTIAQLKAYKDGSRRTGINKMMQEVAAKLSDEEIEAVAHYVAGLH